MERLRVHINGIVQGVGFRPFVFNFAKQLELTGEVSNTAQGVLVEIQGKPGNVQRFVDTLEQEAPPLAVIAEIGSESMTVKDEDDFRIIPSSSNVTVSTLISPDVAICEDCRREMFDPSDRRHLYPFINCTNCGPRYTIIQNIPYDRPFTSMRHFELCPECLREYEDPQDRRFHAQPNACHICGPHVWLTDDQGEKMEDVDPVAEAARLLGTGMILAIKGLGGFHLAVDARDDAAVNRLRETKGREEKPFALMVKDMAVFRRLVNVSEQEERQLRSIQAPIILLRHKDSNAVAPSVAPGNDRLGIMLPYTPLHHLLMTHGPDILVMTSANYSEEPICIDNDEAITRLSGMADHFLLHNRDIYLRTDDSVSIELAGVIRSIRRSRGFAPRPVFVQSDGPSVLAVGGELKNTVCLLKDRFAFLSQHIGDLENLEAYDFFKLTADHLQRIFESSAELIVHDMHPRYLSTQWAEQQEGIPRLAVQHHHAHLAACMAENKLEEPVIGLILDGTGYGIDGTIWGGEILVGDYDGFERAAHLEPLLLPGGDAAIRAPWRIAYAYLHQAFDGKVPDLPFLQEHDCEAVSTMVEREFQTVLTSSMGRLFDAVAAMSGGRQEIRYEAQAAIEFMQAAGQELNSEVYDRCFDTVDSAIIWKIKPLIRAIANDILDGLTLSEISRRFHATLVEGLVDLAGKVRRQYRIDSVALSGGVFQNQLLFENVIPALERADFEVYTHSQVPTNDGGIALGQALIGRRFLVDQELKNENK